MLRGSESSRRTDVALSMHSDFIDVKSSGLGLKPVKRRQTQHVIFNPVEYGTVTLKVELLFVSRCHVLVPAVK